MEEEKRGLGLLLEAAGGPGVPWWMPMGLRRAISEAAEERERLRARVAELEGRTMDESEIEAMGWMRLPLGKDGVPIRVGDTVYGPDGLARKAAFVSESNGFAYWADGRFGWCFDSGECTHKLPDSWERLEEDAGMLPVDYCRKHGITYAEGKIGLPSKRMAMSIAARAKKLAGVAPKCSEATPNGGAE